jgi:hypothetical protein
METKTAILIPYFGKNPAWLDYFLISCRFNPGIDWLLFSDCLTSCYSFPNVSFIQMSLEEFNALASVQLGFRINTKYPYKLCEFKPAYGLIFEKYIRHYDYWGYGDLDLIYGDILKFLPENWSSRYDILSTHTEFIPGHLCILRNIHAINTLFRESPTYKKIFQSPVYHGFDEQLHPIIIFPNPYILSLSKSLKTGWHLLITSIIRFIKKTSLLRKIFQKMMRNHSSVVSQTNDFSSIVGLKVQSKEIVIWQHETFNCDLMFRKRGVRNWSVTWSNGCLRNTDTKQELMYFHFPLSKNKTDFIIKHHHSHLNSFKISPRGIE